MVTLVHDGIDASIQKEMKKSDKFISQLYKEFWWFKNDIKYNCRPHKIIIQIQIGLEITLVSKFEHFKCNALIKLKLQCAIFDKVSLKW